MEDQKPNPNSTKKPALEFLLNLIQKIADSAGAVISADAQKIYVELLGDYTESILEQAAAATIADWREASKMPPLAFILDRCTQAMTDKQQREQDEQRHVAQNVLDELMKRRPSDVSHDEVLLWLEEGKQKQRDHIAKLNACRSDTERQRVADLSFTACHDTPADVRAQTEALNPKLFPKGWSLEDIHRARLTIAKFRQGAALPYAQQPGNELGPDGESRADFAKRVIAEMRDEIKAGTLRVSTPELVSTETYQAYAARLAKERLGPTQVPTDPEERKRWAHQKALDSGWLERGGD